MTLFQAAILGLVQGLTEFLPISSTAHLLIVPQVLGWDDPGSAFSAAIQLGTLVAVFVYFAADIRRLLAAMIVSLRQRDLRHSSDSVLAWSIIPGTLPVAVLGLLFKDQIDNEVRSLAVVAIALIALALALLLAERLGKQVKGLQQLSFWHIQIIGLCQALALIPGASRSGSTIMGGLFIGLRRADAARFSFILGLPAIGASGLFKLGELIRAGIGGQEMVALAVGVVVAGVTGYLSIGMLLRFLERRGTHLFAFYRIVLGAGIIACYTW